MSFTPESYYSFTVYDETQKTIPDQFITANCNNCNCGDNTINEFYDLPHTLLMNSDYTGSNLYLTYYASIIGTNLDKTTLNCNLMVEPKGGSTETLNVCTLGGLDNFWRSAVNLNVRNLDSNISFMSVSQACPIRYSHFKDLILCFGPGITPNAPNDFTCCPDPNNLNNYIAEFTSGGFISDCSFDSLNLCSQQQFMAQNCILPNNVKGGSWNIVFYNCQNPPIEKDPKYTIISDDELPLPKENILKAPLLFFENESYKIKLDDQNLDLNNLSVAQPNTKPTNILDSKAGDCLDDFFDINKDNSSTIIIPCGVYYITKKHTIQADIIGIGMAIIRCLDNSGLILNKPRGVMYSIIFDNFGTTNTTLEINSDNVSLFDLFFRNGGPNTYAKITDTMLKIKGKNCYLNNLWIWRADHGIDGTFKKDSVDCPATTGLIVEENADNCTAIGLAVEHFDETNVIWKGDNGQCAFFQNEMPYFVKSFDYPAVDLQKNFKGYGMGSYCFFRDYPVNVPYAFKINPNANVYLQNIFTVWLNGNQGSQITNVLNNGIGNTSSYSTKGKPQYIIQYQQKGSSPTSSPTSIPSSKLNKNKPICLIIFILLFILFLVSLILYIIYKKNIYFIMSIILLILDIIVLILYFTIKI